MLKYISTEECEYLYIDGVSADEMSKDQLINIYKECIKSISTKPKDSMREFIVELLSATGQMEFVFHCDQCGDSVYDYIVQTTHHKAVYTEGCTCYGLHIDEYDYDDEEVSQNDVIEFLNETYEYFIKNPDGDIAKALMEFVRLFGEFDEEWYDKNNSEHTYNELYTYTIQ